MRKKEDIRRERRVRRMLEIIARKIFFAGMSSLKSGKSNTNTFAWFVGKILLYRIVWSVLLHEVILNLANYSESL